MKEVTLDQVAVIHGGGRLKLTGRDFVPEGVAAYGAGGHNGYLPVAESERPAIILASVGTCGRCYLADGPWTSLANTQVIVPDPETADIRFLWHQLNDERRWPRSGTSQPFIKPSDVKAHRVWLPPIAEQRRIANILDQVEVVRAKRSRALAHLDELTRSVFVAMFGDPLKNNHALGQATLGNVAQVVTGNTPPRADPDNYGQDIEWLKSDNLGSIIAAKASERLSPIGRALARTAPAGSVLVTCIAGSPRSIGKASLVDREVAFNQQINAITPGPDLLGRFMLEQLRVSPELVRLKSTGGMKGLVSKSAFASIRILLPPLDQQREFEARANAAALLRQRFETGVEATSALVLALRRRAFAGEL